MSIRTIIITYTLLISSPHTFSNNDKSTSERDALLQSQSTIQDKLYDENEQTVCGDVMVSIFCCCCNLPYRLIRYYCCDNE